MRTRVNLLLATVLVALLIGLVGIQADTVGAAPMATDTIEMAVHAPAPTAGSQTVVEGSNIPYYYPRFFAKYCHRGHWDYTYGLYSYASREWLQGSLWTIHSYDVCWF